MLNMKKLLMPFVVAIIAIVSSSCSVSSYMTQNTNVNQTNVVLSEANFHIVKTVSADVSQTYVFGIGGISKRALKNNAVSELTKKAELTGSQALVNITLHEDFKTILFVNKRTIRAHGTVVEFEK